VRANQFLTVCAWLLMVVAVVDGKGAEVSVRHDMITGRVVNSSTNAGIAGIAVQLLAPRAMREPVRITVTRSDGTFQLLKLSAGKYLMTMYQGSTLVFRREVDTRVETDFTVPLRPLQ
jgi:hypothetical protein